MPFVIMFTVHIDILGVFGFVCFILTPWARAELELNGELWEARGIMVRDDGSETRWITGFSFNGINTL